MSRTTTVTNYAHTSWRGRFLQLTLTIASLLGLVVLIPATLSNDAIYSAVYVAVYVAVLLATFLRLSYNVKAGMLVFLLFGLAIAGLTETGVDGDARSFILASITMASLLFSGRVGWVMAGLALLTYALFGWLILSGTITLSDPNMNPGNIYTWLTGVFVILLLAALIVTGIQLTQKEFEKAEDNSRSLLEELRREQENLEQSIQDRTRFLDKRSAQFQAVADVGKSITSFRHLSELLQQATRLINENFGYYHAGIFLLDERREYAVLAAANSEGGQRMLERHHQLQIGGSSIVGYAIENIRARIALDVGQDAVYFDNPDLPQTRSELALPLVVSGQVLGALDVQSTEPQAFTEDDIATLQILAEQIAVAIQNAKLFDEAEKALEAAKIGYGEISREAWGKILRNQPRIGYIATPSGASPIEADTLEPNLEKAMTTGDLILHPDGVTIGVPIKIRGQVIGAIRLKKPSISEGWTQEEINLAITLSDQLSGALDSARLYSESQARAAREALVSDISVKIGAATQMDAVIRETVSEIGQALGSASVTFQLLDQFQSASPASSPQRSGAAEANRMAGE